MKILFILSASLFTTTALANNLFYYQKYCSDQNNTYSMANGSVENFIMMIEGSASQPHHLNYDTHAIFINEEVLSENTELKCNDHDNFGVITTTRTSSMKLKMYKLNRGNFEGGTPGLSPDMKYVIKDITCSYIEKHNKPCN